MIKISNDKRTMTHFPFWVNYPFNALVYLEYDLYMWCQNETTNWFSKQCCSL